MHVETAKFFYMPELKGARAPVTHSWWRQCSVQFHGST